MFCPSKDYPVWWGKDVHCIGRELAMLAWRETFKNSFLLGKLLRVFQNYFLEVGTKYQVKLF